MSRFKKCPNGHTYKAELSECPICNSSRNIGVSTSSAQRTQVIDSLDGESFGQKTTTDDEPIQVNNSEIDPHKDFSKTMVEEEVQEEDENGAVVSRREVRNAAKLVGWLVTYSLDPNGIDYRLFEGRNIIGRDFNCSVCINDNKVSGQHAILLYRNEKLRIKDNLSVNGTMVNGEDIDDDSRLLNDGDIIQIGDTVLLFRTSLLSK